jgi:hypothetical protein
MMRDPFAVRLFPRILVWALVLITGSLFQTTAAVSQVSSDAKSAAASKGDGTRPATSRPRPTLCPPAGLATLPPSPQITGHHNVTLSWNASPSLNSENQAVGYCIYRSKKPAVAKHNPTCNDCEQVNLTAIAGTQCIDDLVEDGATYYYVVTAINARGKPTSPSNETPAQIPPNKESSSLPKASFPSCRETASSK